MTDRAVPEQVYAEARTTPNGWVYEVAAGRDPDGTVPSGAIVGAWTVVEGVPTGEFMANPNYEAELRPPSN